MPIEFHPEALRELNDAAAWYEARAGLGSEFRKAVASALERIQMFPQMYAIKDESDERYCPVKRFSYFLVYLALDDRLWISAVAHTRRQRGYWSPRRLGEG